MGERFIVYGDPVPVDDVLKELMKKLGKPSFSPQAGTEPGGEGM